MVIELLCQPHTKGPTHSRTDWAVWGASCLEGGGGVRRILLAQRRQHLVLLRAMHTCHMSYASSKQEEQRMLYMKHTQQAHLEEHKVQDLLLVRLEGLLAAESALIDDDLDWQLTGEALCRVRMVGSTGQGT